MSKEPTVRPSGKSAAKAAPKSVAKRPARKPPVHKPEAVKVDDSFAALLECSGLLTDEEGEELLAAVRRIREEE
jgi:hypothetical protein